MKKDNPKGIVTAELGNGLYRVQMNDTEEEVICYLAGKIRINKITVITGDEVEVVLDPAGGKTTNRIVWRK